MKKILLAILVTAIGIATVFSQTSFKDEAITDVKVKGNKVYFYKQIVADSVMCTDAGSKCVIGRTTTLNAEVFEMDQITTKASPGTTREEWVNFYNKGSMPIESNCGCSEDKKGLWHLNSISYIDSTYFNGSMLLRRSKEHYLTPILDKKTGKIYGKKMPDTGWYLNLALLGIILWAIAIGLSNLEFRCYKTKDEDDYSFSNFFFFLSAVFLVIASFYYDSIGWDNLKISLAMFLVIIIYATRFVYKLKKIVWLKSWYIYLFEFAVMITLFIWLSSKSDHNIAQGIYIGIFTAIFYAGSTSFWSIDHDESNIIGTVFNKTKGFILSKFATRSKYL